MDARRAIILIGMAVVGYMLILAWNNDYGQAAQVANQVAQTTPAAQQDTPDITAAAVSETPAAAVDAPVIAAEPAQQVVSTTGLITVNTDVLDLKIDPNGGDIVYAALKAFPQHQKNPDVPYILLDNAARTYIAQTGLVGKNGTDVNGKRGQFSAAQTAYVLAEGQDNLQVVLSLVQDGVTIEKVFTVKRGLYLVDVTYRINNQSAEAWQANVYAQLKRDESADPTTSSAMGMKAYLGAAISTPEERYKKITFKDMTEKPLKQATQVKQDGHWIAFLQHYFLSALVPAKDASHNYYAYKTGDNYLMGYYDDAINVAPGAQAESTTQIYMGPKNQDRLKEIAENLNLTVDYGWLWWIAQPLFWLLQLIHSVLGNWGFAIIVLTILVKAAFFKLSATSYRSMANMRRVAPKLASLKEEFGNDRQRMSKEMMDLYKREKINPLGGCLPILIQMPVFIALYWVLMESVELRQAPWILWITDLSVMDPYFILPIIMGASMFIQMSLNPTPPDPMQAKVMKMMPIIFSVFFLFFPAGLVLYWVVNNVLSIAQQWYITKQIEDGAK
ncbi:MAG: membrane protein insertase YidC [Oceanospirillaceae bacterium]|nr:membrane protein insertase YidC [Oceanospirillaceae bacterium]MCP5334664.1 membrane protein insertase YidC [Oceanospirillaceae bacterium]